MILIDRYQSLTITDSIVQFALKNKKSSVELSYVWKNENINYKIQLVSINSNLGNGKIWFFICPHTGKRCRKLYLIDKYFLHKTAYKKLYYESQTHSSLDRKLYKFPKADKAIKEIDSKYFRKTYKGQFTKRYVKLMKTILEANQAVPAIKSYINKIKKHI